MSLVMSSDHQGSEPSFRDLRHAGGIWRWSASGGVIEAQPATTGQQPVLTNSEDQNKN